MGIPKTSLRSAEVNTSLAQRIMSLLKDNQEGLAKPLIAFLDNLLANPSRRSVQGLYDWLEKSDLPITDDGHFIAWKIVGPNFMDLYSGNFDNSPGKIVEVARNEVDEDPDRTCSYGLHFCSLGYFLFSISSSIISSLDLDLGFLAEAFFFGAPIAARVRSLFTRIGSLETNLPSSLIFSSTLFLSSESLPYAFSRRLRLACIAS